MSEDKLSRYQFSGYKQQRQYVLNRTEQVVHTRRTSCRNDCPRGFHDFTAISLCHTKPVTLFNCSHQHNWYVSFDRRNEGGGILAQKCLLKRLSQGWTLGPSVFVRSIWPAVGKQAVCAVLANGLPDKRCRRLAWSVSGGWYWTNAEWVGEKAPSFQFLPHFFGLNLSPPT